jgi:hypothetical protein
MRELDRRQGDGLDVTLLWEPGSDHLYVAVADLRTRERFRIRVDAGRALDAFHHPYAYAVRRACPRNGAGAEARSTA